MKTAMNPCLKNMIENTRARAVEKGLDGHVSMYRDDELLTVINHWRGMSTPEESEQAVMDDILNLVTR